LIPVPSTVGVPCSFWTLACLAASSTLHSLFGIPVRQASALPRASFRPTPHGGALASGCILPTAGRIRDFHPLERAPAGRTKKRGKRFNPASLSRFIRHLKCVPHLSFGKFPHKEPAPLPVSVRRSHFPHPWFHVPSAEPVSVWTGRRPH
ncbi:hypothetical protein SAMN04487771_102341, partial [[Clostridium] aminophilum]